MEQKSARVFRVVVIATMVVSTFAGSSLLHQGGSYEPQRKANYAIVIAGVPGADKLTLFTKGLKVPSTAIAVGKIKHFNETMKYAGSVQPFENLTITFNDYIEVAGGVSTLKLISDWYKQVICFKNGAIGYARDYKKQGDVLLLPPGIPNTSCPGAVTASVFKNRKFILQGVWPSKFDYEELDSEDTGEQPARFTLELTVDRAIPADMM